MSLMELTLERRDNGTVHVLCDGQDSHDFDLGPLLVNALGQERELINDPVTYGKKVYECLFHLGSAAQLALVEQPERILLVLDGNDLDGVAWEYVYGPYGVSDPHDPAYDENYLVLQCRFVRGLPAKQRIAPVSPLYPQPQRPRSRVEEDQALQDALVARGCSCCSCWDRWRC